MKLRILSIFLLFTFLITSGASCTKGGDAAAQQAGAKKIALKMWMVHDNTENYSELLQGYKAIHPNVNIEFRQLSPEEYESELLNGFALDEGPDIFAVHNTWTQKYQPLMAPMPASVTLPFRVLKGSVKQEYVTEMQPVKMLSPLQVKTMFGDTVTSDVVLPFNEGNADNPKITQRIFGLPLSLDTLVLYYNRDILDKAGIASPVKYWTDLQAQVEKIRRLDLDNNVLLAAIPLGTSTNIDNYFDILSLLMMQLRANMIVDGTVEFDKIPQGLAAEGVNQAPGLNALEFYTQFADPILSSYTWNDKMPNAREAFIRGQAAYYIGYAYDKQVIQAQAPKLNLEVAPMLQVQGYDTVNYANYWVYSVSKKSKNIDYAWDFIKFMTSKDQAEKYLTKAQRPSALRELYDKGVADENLAIFTEQTLTAKSWYRGKDERAAAKIFGEMIDQVLTGNYKTREILELGVGKVQQTLR